ncbi:DUF5134 domain-containing protein [Nocardioides sp. KC13]|uniref:DUF5134 domain-containing protein n=1 Tax=Nocardioides turkmenicus TaxID=2711220 RepID=A0A6M1R8X2_9ACTN|nr:DUF5134 domain-containing protein [Nocardioides sp. KC13]NGN96052.1 DUF5134 domain-containing protein [Nocardioides sp. KC13]
MVEPPWDLLLTGAFVITGTLGVWTLVVGPDRTGPRGRSRLDAYAVLHVNHAAMSAAMIAMIWVIAWGVAVWAQVALFALLAVALLPALRRAGDRARRADLVGHLALNAAMIWMLAAMPVLMAGTHATSVEGHAGHGGAAAPTPAGHAPGWAVAVNAVFIAVCVAGLFWWLLRATAVRRHRLPAAAHGLMAAGMGAMLVLMPA